MMDLQWNACCACDPQGVLNKEKAMLCVAKPGFFFVAEGDEISNLELIKDLDKIVKLLAVLNMQE